jgi:hypothetical protein
MEIQGRSATAYDGPGVRTAPTSGVESVVPSKPLQSSVDGGVGRVVEQLEEIIERYPWPTVVLGLAVGFVLARWMR